MTTSTLLNIPCPHCNVTNRVPTTRLGEKPKCGKCQDTLFTGAPINLTDANSVKHISKTDLPVLVDFWASWCGPCKSMGPVFSQAAHQMEPNVRFAKVDTEAAQQTAAKYNIRSIPTLILFRHGKEIARQAGALNPQQLNQWLSQQLG
jgi:thioredoxin 2